MSEITAVYKSDAPSVIEAWDLLQERASTANEHRRRFIEDFPGLTPGGHAEQVTFVAVSDTPDSAVWRWSRSNHWVPRKRGGEAMRERFALMSYEVPAFPGMPEQAYTGIPTRFRGWGGRLIDGWMWAAWSVPTENVEQQAEFDPAIWQPMPVSSYYLALETAGVRS